MLFFTFNEYCADGQQGVTRARGMRRGGPAGVAARREGLEL